MRKVAKTFESESDESFNENFFNENVGNLQMFLFEVNHQLPGPQHPSVKFYRLRQIKKNRKITSAQQSCSSNPQRTDTKAKQRRQDKYQYDLTRYWYYNQRKKAVSMVLNEGRNKQCRIRIMEQHFRNVFEKENNCTRESYPTVENHNDITISERISKNKLKE